PRQVEDDALAGRFTAVQLFQENVFVEGNRPQYLVDLHSEAQEGLKILQQEEKENGVDYQDDQSISSAVTLRGPEEEASFGDMSSSLDSSSITADTMSMVSARSITSTQSAFTRQGSTFRPLNQGKHGRVERPRRKDRRTTVMGIPQHVQNELGLDRATWLPDTVDGQLPNGGSMVIPATDGEDPVSGQQESNVHLQAFEALHSSSAEQQLRQRIESMYRHGPYPSPLLKYRSLAAPGVTTDGCCLQTPPSPVVSISPQASYLSKIIPNAVLPADVDVVEITRSRSRSSMRTLSKSSLVTASPAPSRASDRYSNYNRYELSSRGSNWSHSQSSDTIVSDSSTISSQGSGSTPRASRKGLGKVGGTEGYGGQTTDQVSGTTSVNGTSMSLMAKDKVGAKVSKETEGLEKDCFVRSMSVTKTKRPPPPPRRTNSLHQDKFRHHSQKPVNRAGMLERTLSPSSGYSNRGGTPIKGDKSKTTEAFQSLLPSATSEPIHKEAPANSVQFQFAGLSNTVTIPNKKVTSPSAAIVLRELFDIPEPPKVAAPLSPPPETWVHNRRTLSLLCGLSTSRLVGLKKKQDSWSTRRREVVGNGTKGPLSGAESKRTAILAQSATEGAGHIQVAKKLEDPTVLKKEEASPVVQKMELGLVAKKDSPEVRKEAQGSPGTPRKRMFFLATQKKEKASPEVQKKEPMAQKGNRDKVAGSPLAQRMNVMLPAFEDRPPTAPLTHAPPFPPPTHHPPPPSSEQTSTSSVSSLPSPPPMEQLPGRVFEGQDELDFLTPPLATPPLDGAVKMSTSLLVPTALGVPSKTKTTPALLVQNKSPAGSKQQPSAAATQCMEQKPLLRSKSTPMPKEDASLPMVTPSLLHTIRLRSVHPAGGSKSTDHEEGPQKPIPMPLTEAPSPPTMTRSPPSAVQLNVSTPHTETTTLSAVIAATSTPTKTPTLYTVPTGPSAAKPTPPTTSETRVPTVSPPTVVASPPAAKPTVKFASAATPPAFSKISVPSTVTLPPPTMEHSTPSMTPVPPTTAAPLPASKPVPPITLFPSSMKTTEVSTTSIMTTGQSTAAPTATATQCNVSNATAKLSVSTPIVTATQSPTTPTATATPSMRLQEAIRMKTAAMSSRDGPRARLNVRTSVSSSSPHSPEGGDLHKSPASTASFIFSKKVMEMPSSVDVQSNLRKSLVTEGQLRSLKMPPPVSRKPMSHLPSSSYKPESSVEHVSLTEPGLSKEVGKEQLVDHEPLVKEDLGST
ncbi:hypothetical protein Z043_122655, partial [Scleropages formosus]